MGSVTPEMLEAGLLARDTALIEDINDPIGAFNIGALKVCDMALESQRKQLRELVDAVKEYLPLLTNVENSGAWDLFARGTGIATANRLRDAVQKAERTFAAKTD